MEKGLLKVEEESHYIPEKRERERKGGRERESFLLLEAPLGVLPRFLPRSRGK